MGFLDSIKRGLRLIKLDSSAAVELTQDKSSLIYGWIIIIVAVILSELARSIQNVPFEFSFINLIISIIVGPFLILVNHGLAKLFGGQSKLPDYFRAQSHVFLLSWLLIFTAINLQYVGTILEWVIGIWSVVMSVVVLKSVHKLNTWKSMVVALALPLILIILVAIGALAFFGVLSPDRFLPVK